MATNTMNIFQRMSAITDEINRVAKNLRVGVGQSAYKAVGEADVLEAVKPAENKFGVYSYPRDRKIVDTREYTVKNEYSGKIVEKTTLFMRVETIYRFVNVDVPEEYIEVTTYGDGVDPQDKAPGKAMTYSDKYALLKAYKIETGDDPDQGASKDMKPKAQERNPENTKANDNINPESTKERLASDEEKAAFAAAGGNVEKLAIYHKCKPSELTRADVLAATQQKLKALNKAAGEKPWTE